MKLDEDAWELGGSVETRTIVFWVGSGVVAWLLVGLDPPFETLRCPGDCAGG